MNHTDMFIEQLNGSDKSALPRGSVAVVIPTYNEAENIGTLLGQLMALNLGLQAVVVDDSSPDGTAETVAQLRRDNPNIHLVRRKGARSFGGSYIDGFKYAMKLGPEYIIQMDADLSHPPQFIRDFLKSIAGNDLLIGSRYQSGIRILNWSIRRLAMSLLANRYIKIVLGLPFADCTSGFRCWRTQALMNIRLKHISSSGYSFLVEMAYLAFKNKLTIKEIPIVFIERQVGDSKMCLKLIIESALLPWRLRSRSIFFKSSISGKEKEASVQSLTAASSS